jgi:predicted porin
MRRAYQVGLLSIVATMSEGALAQSSVTLYGTVDASIQYLTHAKSAGDSQTQMGSGGLSQSRFGVSGNESIGGGNSVIFRLENRFATNTGVTDPSGPFWDTVFVGLRSSTLGTLALGRQTNPMADTAALTYPSNPWLPYDYKFQPEITLMGGIWSSNMAKYQFRYGRFVAETSYAFGGVAGHTSYGSQLGAGVAYVGAIVGLGASYLNIKDSINGADSKAWSMGGSLTWQGTQAHLGYFENRLSPGFGTWANGPYTPLQLAALKFTDFSSRRMFSAGVSQTLLSSTHLSFNYWRTFQTGKTDRQNGTASQFQVVVDQSLSRRTDVYLEVDYSIYREDLIGAQLQGINGLSSAQKGTQLGMMAGVRHQF